MPRIIYLQDGDLLSEILVFVAVIAISVGLVLPLWGLAVILFNFTLVFLPVFIGVGVVLGIIKVLDMRHRDAHR